ncbi:MAG TPA: TonB-dependent receptor [Flavisolibacter sp.]|nr:TonB-dependent receptor [Flavisolibacter sp.]
MKKNILYARGWRIMKLTFLFMLLTCLQVSARTYSQERITVNLQSTDLKKALSVIEKKSSYHFLYNEAVIANKPKIDLNVKDAAITTVLDRILTANGISYRILDNNLIVLRANGENVSEVQDIRLSGRVTGSNGEALSGVSVTIKGTSSGTTTDANGNFEITVPDQNTVLVFSYVGYGTQEVTVGNRTSINVSLVGSASQMDNIVVVGYGTQRKLDVTGSVGQIRGEEIAKQASINPISALQGKLAGVQITNSGAPGASPQIRIRGLGTVYGNSNPLYVVDGVWFDDISFLNPADIENISVLKDASSEAIYGVRAANGVILITTKKGRGKTTVNYSGFVGIQRVTNQVKMANGTEYATLVNELNQSIGSPAPFANPASFGEGTNWFDVILRNALITNHHVSIGGGTERSTFNFSLGYLKQEGIVEGHDYDRVTARLQNDFQVAKFLKLGYSAVLLGSQSNDIPDGVIYKAYTAAPIVPVRYADGSYGDPNDYPIGTATNNPKIQLDFFDQKSKNYRLTGSAFGEVRLHKNLNFRSSIGGEFGEGEVLGYTPVYTQAQGNSIQFNNTSRLNVSRAQVRNWILENTLNFDKSFGEHNVKVLVGQTAQRYRSYSISASADNVPKTSDGDLYLSLGPNTTANPRTVSDAGDLATYASYFGRVNYSFSNRYLLSASLRADGSSKFIGDERWGYFPSVGAGWIISDESFMQDQGIFDYLKLRGSWGKVGNASVPANLAVQLIDQRPEFTAIIGGQPAPGASITSIVPPVIYWERGVGTDIGLEGTLLNKKLNFEIDWYNRKTEQAIFDIPVIGSLGLGGSSIRGNQADFENTGFELTLGWRDDIGKDFNYSLNGNFSINNNKVLSVVTGNNPIFAGGAAATGGQLSTRTIAGQPIGQFYGLQVAGIFQTAAEVTGSAQPSARPGDFRYVDMNKDGVINALDRVILGNPNPKYTYGLNTNFNFRQFDLTLDVQGVAGVDIYNANKGLRFGSENFSKDFFDNRWSGPGTSNTYPSANIGGGTNYIPNSWYVEDGSYVRIRNVQLGYTLPQAMTSRLSMQRVRIYVNAQNALNFFSYTGFTPEVGGGPTNAGIDNGIYPLSATYNFGVNVSF